MQSFKLTAWNIEHADKLAKLLVAGSVQPGSAEAQRLSAIAEEIDQLDADVLMISEAPSGKAAAKAFFDHVAPRHTLVARTGTNDKDYDIRGTQWMWFLLRSAAPLRGSLQHIDHWRNLTAASSENVHSGGKWPISFPITNADMSALTFKVPGQHSHYRHPQVLLLEIDGTQIELIGCHLKSKINKVRVPGDAYAPDFFDRNPALVADIMQSRIKLTTECSDIRHYINSRFSENPNVPIIVLGDLNDGPGKERIEERFLYHDLLSSLQGDVFFARQFLNHALFDFDQEARWSYDLGRDKLDPRRNPKILLDHILFTQSLSGPDGPEKAPWRAMSGTGKVEHEVHHRIASSRPSKAATSDHRPVSMQFSRRPA